MMKSRRFVMVHWDIDRYEELQDAAWENEITAADRDKATRLDGHLVNGAADHAAARAMRVEAAQLLAQYWVPR
jgi:hypothetical protein